MKVIKYHLFNAYHLQPTVFTKRCTSVNPHSNLEERNYDPYLEELKRWVRDSKHTASWH